MAERGIDHDGALCDARLSPRTVRGAPVATSLLLKTSRRMPSELRESFLIPMADITTNAAMRGAVYNAARHRRIRVSVRMTDEGMRVWRIG